MVWPLPCSNLYPLPAKLLSLGWLSFIKPLTTTPPKRKRRKKRASQLRKPMKMRAVLAARRVNCIACPSSNAFGQILMPFIAATLRAVKASLIGPSSYTGSCTPAANFIREDNNNEPIHRLKYDDISLARHPPYRSQCRHRENLHSGRLVCALGARPRRRTGVSSPLNATRNIGDDLYRCCHQGIA